MQVVTREALMGIRYGSSQCSALETSEYSRRSTPSDMLAVTSTETH